MLRFPQDKVAFEDEEDTFLAADYKKDGRKCYGGLCQKVVHVRQPHEDLHTHPLYVQSM